MSSKQKNIFLIIGFCFMLVIIYILSIKKTIAIRSDYKTMQSNTAIYDNLPQRLGILNRKEKYYDSLLAHYKIDGRSIQNNLLKTINRYARESNVVIEEFATPHKFIEKDKTVYSYQVTVSGNTQSILGLLYALEQESKFGEVASVTFEKVVNYRSQKPKLYGRFMIQLVQ